MGLILLVAVCYFLFGIDFGPNWALTFLLTSLGALVGLSFGVAISALVPGGENMKVVVKRFLDSALTMEEVSMKMDAFIENVTKLPNN